MENLVQIAGQYGALGLSLLACFWYINKKDSEAREERNKSHEDFIEMHENALTAINNNTAILNELKGVINSK